MRWDNIIVKFDWRTQSFPELLMVNLQSSNQFWMTSRCFCRCADADSGFWCWVIIQVSPASFVSKCCGKSLVYIRYKMGSKTLPYGSPEWMLLRTEYALLKSMKNSANKIWLPYMIKGIWKVWVIAIDIGVQSYFYGVYDPMKLLNCRVLFSENIFYFLQNIFNSFQ